MSNSTAAGTTPNARAVPEHDLTGQTWVAFGPAGALGSVHRTVTGFTFKLLTDDSYRGSYPSLDVCKSALHAALLPGAEWPEFREH